ncbi:MULTISPECIES: hypothetical protein [unclassified Tolypothrix]|uniref:hypothetical protein n=1 Tax=unclassified Tolypothrix TaxID=2649714 RepID=UPI0005F7B52C|nr:MULTISPECIES: hypothetical protein [unclassified Tolypothrix]MBE9086372.1 hypothetical protein [Tolypothrix sp. LEGE 11397]UYD26192.1 hypothetical protein HGR01_33685 [Tolypothrix sp. PCC 7712]UYD31571.1 hypothetical protein HG267_20830 [Tolypothrix sp. PCC 7601]BAY92218.1 hypothetical protein NIES3275_42510 [Microchaete diplosiphon NIES-3275]
MEKATLFGGLRTSREKSDSAGVKIKRKNSYSTSLLAITDGLFLLQSLAGRKPTPPTLRYLRRLVLDVLLQP